MAILYPEYTALTTALLNQSVEIHIGDAQKCRLRLKLTLTDAILHFIIHVVPGGLLRRFRSPVHV